jgi:integrase
MPKKESRLKPLGVKDGKRWWQARLTWRDPVTGKQVIDTTQKFAADTKAKAEAERERRLDKKVAAYQGKLAAKKGATFGQLVEKWYATIESRGTKTSWGSHVNSKILPDLGNAKLDKVTPQYLQRWLDHLEGPRGPLGWETVNSVRQCLVKAFQYGIDEGYCTENPAAQTRRRTKPRPRADQELQRPPRKSLDAGQIPAFFDALKAESGGEFFVLVVTQFALGARFGEVSALKAEDVTWDTGETLIRRAVYRGAVGPTKSREARVALLGTTVLQLLKEHRAQMMREQRPGWADGWLFPRNPRRPGRGVHQSHNTVSDVLKRVYKTIGATPRGKTHVMRHTMNNVARQRVSDTLLRKVIGHSSEEMTDRYSHPEMDELRELASAFDDLLQ